MPLHARFAAAAGGAYTVSIERLVDGLKFDFSTNLFASSPVTELAAMTAGTSNNAGLYLFDITSTPSNVFTDGEYATYIHNTGTANQVVSALPSTMINGDSVPLSLTSIAAAILDVAASSHNVASSIGAKINSAAAAGDPLASAVPGSYASGTAGFVLGTNLNATVSSRTTGNVTVGAYAGGQDPATLVLDATASAHNTSLTVGAKINSAASAADPMATIVPGIYTPGQAGYAIGTNLNATVSSRTSGNVTVGAYASGQDPATLVLDATALSHNTSLTVGAKINAAGSNSDPLANTVSSYTTGQLGFLIGTNLNATVASRTTGNVTVGAYASGQDPATLVLDATASAHNTSLTVGSKINSAGSSGDPLTNTVSTYSAGQLGYILGTNLNATVSSRTTGNVTVGGYATGQDPGTLAWANATRSLTDKGGFALAPAGLDGIVVETGLNARQSLAIIAAATAGSGNLGNAFTIAAAGVPGMTRITGVITGDSVRQSVNIYPPA